MAVNSEHELADGTGSPAFAPITVGNVAIKNRICVPAHTTNFGLDNLPTDRHTAYHEARARGGAGLIIMESLRVHPTSLGKPQGLAAYDPRCVGPLADIAEAVHGHGAKIFGQIIHLGRQIDGDALRLPPWGPSPIAWDAASVAPHVMTGGDITEVIDGHVTSAHNVLAAGFDGLEVHVGHGHLLQQFLSPATNERTDRYGGSESNRMRFPMEVLKAVRDSVGPDVCLGVRISADEYAPGGLTLDDMTRIVPQLADRITLDFVNVSHSAYHGSYSLSTQMADMAFPSGMFRHLAPEIRRSLHSADHYMPVIAVCKFRTVAEAEEVLAAEGADLIGMARAHIADPNLVVNARNGHSDRTRTCIGCNQGCAGFLEKGLPITCVVNPTAGRERIWTPDPAADPTDRPKRVLVVGGGPAGLEAAWVAAARGHHVELVERANRLGGQLRLLDRMPKRRDFVALIDQQIEACKRHGVDLRLDTTFDADETKQPNGPDHIVIATGSRLQAVTFPDGGTGLTLAEALSRRWNPEDRVAFYDLIGDWASLGVVEFLADLGVSVTYLTPVAGYGWKITRYSKTALTARLREAKVAIRLMRSAHSFADGVFTVEDLSTGDLESLPATHVVAAGNPTATTTTFESGDYTADPGEDAVDPGALAPAVEVTRIGDCLAPRTALEAVYEGHRIGRAI